MTFGCDVVISTARSFLASKGGVNDRAVSGCLPIRKAAATSDVGKISRDTSTWMPPCLTLAATPRRASPLPPKLVSTARRHVLRPRHLRRLRRRREARARRRRAPREKRAHPSSRDAILGDARGRGRGRRRRHQTLRGTYDTADSPRARDTPTRRTPARPDRRRLERRRGRPRRRSSSEASHPNCPFRPRKISRFPGVVVFVPTDSRRSAKRDAASSSALSARARRDVSFSCRLFARKKRVHDTPLARANAH